MTDNMKLIGGTIVAAFIAFLLFMNHSLRNDVQELARQNGELTTNNSTLKENLRLLEKSNSANLQTIKELDEERADNKAIVESVSKKNAASLVSIEKIKSQAQAAKGTENDAPVAPVLRQALKDLQARD